MSKKRTQQHSVMCPGSGLLRRWGSKPGMCCPWAGAHGELWGLSWRSKGTQHCEHRTQAHANCNSLWGSLLFLFTLNCPWGGGLATALGKPTQSPKDLIRKVPWPLVSCSFFFFSALQSCVFSWSFVNSTDSNHGSYSHLKYFTLGIWSYF